MRVISAQKGFKKKHPPAQDAYGDVLVGNQTVDLTEINRQRTAANLPPLSRRDARELGEKYKGDVSMMEHLLEGAANPIGVPIKPEVTSEVMVSARRLPPVDHPTEE